MTLEESTVTVVAVGITLASSFADGLFTDARLGLPPDQSPPMSTVPPPSAPDASIFALVTSMASPVTMILPPVEPAVLPYVLPSIVDDPVPEDFPEADKVPEIFTTCFGAPAGLLAPVAAPSTITPFLRPTELASITPVLLMTESTTWRAAAAVSSTRPPLALSLPSF